MPSLPSAKPSPTASWMWETPPAPPCSPGWGLINSGRINSLAVPALAGPGLPHSCALPQAPPSSAVVAAGATTVSVSPGVPTLSQLHLHPPKVAFWGMASSIFFKFFFFWGRAADSCRNPFLRKELGVDAALIFLTGTKLSTLA